MEPAHEKRSVVASGKTVDDAIHNGLAMLRVHPDQVEIEVLSAGSRGILGLGAENARVRLVVKPPPPKPAVTAPAPVPPPSSAATPAPPAKAPAPVREAPTARAPAPKPESRGTRAPEPKAEAPKTSTPDATPDESTPEGLGKHFLSELLSRMGIPASVEVLRNRELAEEGQEPPIVLNITGDDLGILIGRRGETLRALQYLVRLMVSHRLKQWNDLIVDVEDYRVRRRRALESLAQRIAERVAKEGRSQALEPMPAYERRIVHIALRKHPKVTTQSVGEGERRKVTIVPKGQGRDGR